MSKKKVETRGRKPAANPRAVHLAFRVTRDEDAVLRKAAAAENRPLSEYVRLQLLDLIEELRQQQAEEEAVDE